MAAIWPLFLYPDGGAWPYFGGQLEREGQRNRKKPYDSGRSPRGLRRFKRVTLWEVDVVVKMCEYKAFKMSDLIYNLGRTIDEMLLLLQGNLVAIYD